MERSNGRPPATTISTIAVRSGASTKIVIALLQSRDVLELKVLELCPELTLLGETLEEALSLQAEHERVLEKIQEKQSPVSELLKKADHLIATQNTQPEVYAAMADSLGLAWKDVNDILQKRSSLLHLNVEYHRQAELCMERIRALEMLCHSYLPTEVEAIKNHLDQIHEVRKSVLESLMVALGNGTQLLDFLKEIHVKGTLDSRPGYNQHSTSLAISQVEHWLEKLHDNRHSIDVDCHERKTMLEKRLTISLLVTDLNLLENIILERQSSLGKVRNSLGDSQYECSKFTEVNENLIVEAKDIRDQALRVVKATEQLHLTKGYMEEDYKFKAYKLLEMTTEYMEELSLRERLLDSAMKFFKSAEKLLRAWDTILQHSSDENLSAKTTYVTETVKRTGASVIQEGNLLLREVPQAEGVKRVVEELERKKQLILSIVMKDHDKYLESSEAVTTFSENYNKIFSWLVSSAESFLHEHNYMGTNLKETREFLDLHKSLQMELRTRGIDINALVSSTNLPPLTYIDADSRVELESKSTTLKDHWTYLDRILSWRVQLAELFVKFYLAAETLDVEFSKMDEVVTQPKVSDQGLDTGHKLWTYINQLYVQLKNTGEKCLHQSSQSEDVQLDLDVARERVRSVLDLFADRKTSITSVWESWQRTSAENESDRVLWKETMCESSKTVDWVSKLDAQLYPILKSEPSTVDRHISEVENKLNNILPEVKRAQNEIETRIKTAEELIGKGNIQGEHISIPPRLKELHSRLVSITTEYQNLLDMFLSFFNSLREFHKTVKDAEQCRPADICNLKLDEVEELLRKHNKSRQVVLDNFKTVYAENIRLMDKIKQQEPQKSAEQDMYVVRCLMENERNVWDQSCEMYCQKIEQQQQLSQFDNDLIQINNNLNDLSQQLASTRGQYGANLASAKSASLAFHYFEKTILLLEQRIETFINAANSLMSFDHAKSEHIKEELNKLKSRWDTFQAQVAESRIHIDLCVQYFTLIEEAQQWFHEGSKVLMNIARKSTEVKTREEATVLLNEIDIFLKPGDKKQEDRINQIDALGAQLYGKHTESETPRVVAENKELLDSFSLLSNELKSFDEKLKSIENVEENTSDVNRIITNTYDEIMSSTAVKNNITSEDDNATTKKIKLDETIQPKPEIIAPLHDNTVEEGKMFTFECGVDGEPSKVTWYKDGISIENNPDYRTSKVNNRYILTIEETFVEDSANFTCRAENDSGFSETSAYLSVKECEPENQISPSVFTKLLSDVVVKEGQPCSLSCKAEGNPLPTVQWYKDDVCVENNPQYLITYNNGDAILEIEHAQMFNKGKYICVATNKLGSDSTSSKLFVDALEIPHDVPKFIVPLSNIMARAGQKLKFECEVETNEPPTLIWFHDGRIMKEIKDFKTTENRGKINLIIPEAYPKDAGTYTLKIKTQYGEASSSCQVSVKGILPNETSDTEIVNDMDPVKPSIPLPLKEQTIQEGGSAHLKCVIVGEPEPEVIWYHNGRPVKESKDIQLLFQGDQCSLVIKEAFTDDAGDYKVVAINSAGEASSVCTLKINPKPVPEIDELVVAPKFTKLLSDVLVREGDSITLECIADGCPKPEFKWIRNTVEIRPDKRISLRSDEDGTAVLHIPSALPADKGQYTVRAVNKAGEAKCFSHVIVKAMSSFDIANVGVTDGVKHEDKLEKPVFTETFGDATVFPGDFVKFECIVVGKPTPKVRWFFNEKPVSGKFFLVSTSGDRQVLTVPEAEASQAGIIECVAENEAGKCSCACQLKIKETEIVAMANNNAANYKPIVSSDCFESSSKFESKRSMFTSSTSATVGDGASKFKIDSLNTESEKQSHQFGDNAPVQFEALRSEEYHNVNGQKSQHVIDHSSTNGAEGRQTSFYERSLMNQELRKDNSQTTLSERNIVKQVRKSTAPRFVSAPQGKIAEQGDDVFLEAIIDSYPPSDITWSKNGVELFPDGSKLTVTNQVNRNRLDIKCLTVADGGQYTCKAVNTAGSTTCTTDIIVRKNVFPPVMCRRLLPSTVAEGERVVLEVEVAGTPEPAISWFWNNQPLKFPSSIHRFRQQGNCSAIIIEKATLNHAGDYKVVAKNEGGEAVSCAELRIVQPIPDVPGTNVCLSSENDLEDQINVAEFFENERRYNRPPPQWPVQSGQHKTQIHSPQKFSKGNCHESDYESDYESNRRIQSIWRPYDSESEEPVYKPVRPAFKQSTRPADPQRHQIRTAPVHLKEITDPGFELKPGTPPEMGFAPSQDSQRSAGLVETDSRNPANSQGYDSLEMKAEAMRLQRVDEMRKRFEQKSLVPANESNSFQTVPSQINHSFTQARDGTVISPIYQKELNATEQPDPSHSIPFFVTPLKDIAVVSGKTARFECIVQGDPVEDVVWMCNGQVLDKSDCYQMQYRNGVCRMTIPKAYQFNAGSYVCTVSNYLGACSTSANLQVSDIEYVTWTYDVNQDDEVAVEVKRNEYTIHEGFIVQQSAPRFGNDAAPPVFEQIFKNARFAQGGNAVFQGKVTGIPKPFVSWTRKGAPLLESSKYQMTYDQQTGNVVLTINHIGPGDEGEYTCSARNQYGEAICSVFIQPEAHTVQQIPQNKYGSQRVQQTQNTLYSNNYHTLEEDFKVDTFEYRLLREVSFRQSVTKRYLGEQDVKFTSSAHQGPVVAPQVLQKPRNSKLMEGSNATFTVKVSTAKDTRLTWFRNGQRLVNGPKHQINFTNQLATLHIPEVQCEDSGHYTLLVENPQGCVVSSAYLAVESVPIVYDPSENKENIVTKTHNKLESVEAVEGKMLAPNFVRVCGDRDVTEGKMTRFEVRVTGKPYPEVSWYINGQHIKDDATHKILVNESGDHCLMITNVSQADAGQVVCAARSRSGETSFQCKLGVVEKELVVAPKFVQRFTPVNVNEEEPVTLSVRAVGTPVPRITWQKDGVMVSEIPGKLALWTEGGGSVLEIASASPVDAGWYQCTAQNTAGSTATRARLNVIRKPQPSDLEDRRLRFPKPTRVIEPEPEPEPEVVFLKHVERAKHQTSRPEEDRVYPPPRFIVPLSSISQHEDGRIHFEARIEPVGDPSMTVEWFVNGYPLKASSRVTTLFSYGFIALDIMNIIQEDSGEYTCRVTSSSGTVQSSAMLDVQGRDEIDKSSQYPDSLKLIEQLEDYSKYQRTDSYEDVQPVPPTFVRPLHDMGDLNEGRYAHFEAQLNPVSDPTMKVEWYKDGKPITASSRITTIFNFGYVSLNIMHLRVEDSGEYTLRAINRWGEIMSTSRLNVIAHSNITGDLGYPEQQRYIEQTEALEQSYQQHKNQEYKTVVPESLAPPQFKTPIKDQINVKEGGFAHFEARLEPLGDSTLQVEWLKDGKPVEASSRMTVFFNFGYVALTIKQVTSFDIGTYTCRAYNNLGDASTSAALTVLTRKDVVQDSQYPGGIEKFQYLEDSKKNKRKAEEETIVTQKPRFLGPLKGTNKIAEGQRAHFEVRVEPQNDVTMKIEWYFNGRSIMSANRIQTYHDFGYVALDILSVRAEDTGTYEVVARNAIGETQLSTTMQVEVRANIDTTSMHRGVVEKAPYLEARKFTEPQYDIEEISKSKPIFIQPLSDPQPVNEGKNVHLECRLEPMGDPTMRVEWFQNGKPVTVGSRFRTYYDFGYVALDIIHVTSIDSGEYTVRATNHLGSAHTSACVNVISRSGILTESQNEYALEQIQLLEDASRYQKMVIDDESVMQAPQFTKPLHNIQTSEGTNVHLECRLKPVGDSTMRVDWLVNGRPVKIGHRFRPAYDFDYVALDILSVYPEDSGVYTCQARNEMGEAVTSSSVKVIAKKDLILDTQNPSGLEKIQYLEDSSRYKKAEMIEEEVKIKPRFLTKPKNVENLKEGKHAHFECKLEPVTDSNLKVEWFKNGRPIIIGHRFRPIHDFGYVALDIIDLIEEDSGTYTCRAINLLGSDETNCHLSCRGSKAIVTEPQNEMGLEQIQYLEERTRYHRKEEVEETTTQAPIFTTSLKNCDIKEGQRAHFECRLIPVSDSTMKVEWFHNNVPIKFGSRFTETNNFGFVALDILQCLPEDSGTYTCRATNWLGQSITSGNLNVQSRKSIYLESQHQEALGRLSQLENANRYQRHSVIEDVVTQAPVFTQPMRDLKTAESQSAHFEARLIPVGDDKLKVEWLRNGIPIQASNRVTTMHDFGYVALNLKYVYPEDSGTYTCRAVNELGQAVTSATLDVQSKSSLQLDSQHEAALAKLRQLEDHSKYQRSEEKEIEVTEAPKFIVPLNGTEYISEGQSAHYECRIEPYPDNTLKLEWLHNGKPLQTGHRFRTTYDFGFASLDVLSALPEDSGEYTCRAINKIGRAESSVKLGVQSRASIISESQHQGALQKIQYLEDDSRYKRAAAEEVLATEKPQFGRPLKNVEHLPEGKSVHLEATLIPVNDPTMKVEWFRNGIPIPQGHRFKTTYDFGFVALDVLYAYPEDSGTYMCKAKNAAGEAVTTCIVTVDSKAGLQLDTLDEDRLKKIKQLEAYERPAAKEAEFELQKPVFLTPLNSLELKEGEHAHLETRIEPINDADLTIEWFVNGVAIKTGHRFKTTHDFGYVALDILYAYGEDSGTYMCKATNKQGEAVNTCQINVASRRSIYLETQHPDGLEKIRELEAQGRPAKLEIDEPAPMAPVLTELWGTTEVAEGKTAHFECQVKPIHDSNLKVEFFHNDKPLGSASRFHTTHDFGYISLDIGHVVPEDAGKYTVKATNSLGQAVSNITLKVQDSGSIILDSQRPEGLDKIRELELAVPFKRADYPEPITKQRPMFTHPLQNIDSINEGQTAHFECRLIPVGDATMTVEWFRNEQPLETSSRITKSYDFGYISLDISHVRDEDNGVYSCKATNVLGEAVTTASMRVRTKDDIQLESQHPEGLKKIVELERSEPLKREEPERVFEKPIFTQLLTGPSELIEGQHAHFECRVVPVGDPTLRFEWYVNGVELKMGSRFHTTHDFGFVTLDINQTIAEDSGVYTCKAINRAGEAVSSTSLKIRDRSSIVREPLQPDSWEQIQLKEAEMNRVPEMFIDTRPQQAPVFTTHLQNQDGLVEGQHVHLEAQVEPRADPNLRIEWFKNGESLTTGSRIRSTFDFGLITLAINSLRPDDSAIYTCKATNLLGEAVSTCTLKIADTNWLLSNTLHPDSLPRIEALEKPQPGRPEGPEPVYESPVFISHLNNWECKEGSDVHFECQVEPSKDPTMKIEWFLNGKPLQTGSRFIPSYDFGFVTLDIKQALAEDSGIYTCKATNDKGYAVTTGTLKCTGFQGIHLDTQHPQGITGLEKVQQVEDILAHKYQRQPSLPETAYPKPIFIVPLEAEFILSESAPLHLEAQVEPKDDPSLKIEWYFNGQVLDLGSRFKTNNDFGFVTLDLTDVYDRDQGVYTCKAYNHSGETYTSTTVYCSSKDGLIEHTQHPKGEEGLGKIQSLEESLQRQKQGVIDKETGHAPEFTSQFKDLGFLSEGEIAHYEASLIPVGDQKMKVEWFYNGKVIEASHRIRTIYAFGMVVLEILGTKIIDTGTYTCRATNDYGTAETNVTLECVERITGQKPKFTSQIESLEGLKDGDSAHFECTLIPVNDPDLKVEWFHNGKPLLHKNRVKMISDFGFVVMDIAYVQNHDSGEYVCKASNKYGEDTTRAKIQCFGKGGVYVDSLQPSSLARIQELENPVGAQRSPSIPVLEAPKFVSQITDITNLKEGQSAHFEARVTPVNDPNLVVEWYFNGEKLQHGHRFRTFHDFGIVILDILCCYEENSGVYECRAFNKVGSDSTKANLRCLSKANLVLESQLPQGMEGGLEKIQTLEDSTMRTKGERVSTETRQAPIFTEPLSNIDSLREGESAHFEGRLTPIDDPNLKVEWYWNGKPLKAGSRFRTFCEFGFVILEISPVYPEDSGDYSCRATNNYGEAVSTSSMKVQGKRSIIMESQLPKGMEGTIDKIAELEGLGQSKATIETEDELGKAPEFITTPADLSLPENSLAHFECRLLPTNDPSMVVTWFHNGKVLSAGSRIKTINDFGFVILEVAGVYIRDSGLYTCKATNKHGEATVTCKLQVKGRQGIVLEPQLPNNFRTGTESIQKLEENMYKKEESLTEDEKPNPPKFIVELKDALDVQEAKSVHFECRVEPINDPTLRIDWFFNGKPFATGSRVHVINDFGFISLDMDYVYSRDSGEYICRATNKWGTAITKANLTCIAKLNVILDSQLPEGMSGEKLKALEQGPVQEKTVPDEIEAVPPKFLSQIESATVEEASSVHFETRVEPKNDPKLRVEWYRNGKPLPSGHRYKTLFDLGFVSLDILSMYAEDSGEYVCRAVNDHGEAITKAMVTCKQLPTILLQNQVPKGMKKSEALTQMEAAIKKYTSEIHLTEDDLYEPEKKQPPRFVTQINDQLSLVEMESTKFECQLAPVGDPNMKVEWFLNGKPLRHKNRFNPIYDFGYVAMNFGWVYPEDSGEYVCRASNLYGEDETRATIKTSGKPGIIYESQLPKGMKSIEKIRQMEASWQVSPEEKEEEEKRREPPQFVSKPEPVTICEGDWARFCCRVTGFPRPRVMWLVNGNTVVNGMRYKLNYDGMWHLDIPKTRQYDHGKVEVIARNSVGESRVETMLTVKSRHDDYRGVLKNSPRPWYDSDLVQYQKDLQENELEKVFTERASNVQQSDYGSTVISAVGEHIKQKQLSEPKPEWTETVKQKKNEEYYNKLSRLEGNQVTKETKIREASHQMTIPGEKIVGKNKGTANEFEETFVKEKKEELMPWQTKILKAKADHDSQFVPDPSESSVHGKEVHISTQKQTQKETQGNKEINRKITSTETTEMEHSGNTQEKIVQGKVKPSKPPIYTKKIQPCRAFEQDQARFEVEFDGEPLPTIKWYREDFLIQNSPDFQIHTFSTKSILIIRQVFMEDSGVFAAIAENRGGKAKCSANLVVEERKQVGRKGPGPPSFLTTIQGSVVKSGQLARFDVKISANKPLDVYWLKNGKKISQDIRYKTIDEDNQYTLLILETATEDSGTYECVAINNSGEARCEAQLLVQPLEQKAKPKEKPTGKEQAPTITQPLSGQVIHEGQPVTFTCKISGQPPINVKWQKGDKLIKPSKYFRMTQDGETVALHISEVFPEDEGTYKCFVSNAGGQAVLSADLKVIVPENQDEAPTLSPMRDVVVPEGSSAQFRTQLTGKPSPTIQWFREGILIPSTPDFKMIYEENLAVLLIKSTYEEDSGVFTCRATNSGGQVETSARLTVKRQHGVTYKTGTFDDKGVVDNSLIKHSPKQFKQTGSQIILNKSRGREILSSTQNSLLPWRTGILVDKSICSIEISGLKTENIRLTPTQQDNFFTIEQDKTFIHSYATEEIFKVVQNNIHQNDVEKAKRIIDQVLSKRMATPDIIYLNERVKHEIVGEVTHRLTQLYTTDVNQRILAKDILNKVLTRSIEKDKQKVNNSKEQNIVAEWEKAKDDLNFAISKKILKDVSSTTPKESFALQKSKTIKQDLITGITNKDNQFPENSNDSFYFGRIEDINYEIVPDEYKPKVKTMLPGIEKSSEIQIKEQQPLTIWTEPITEIDENELDNYISQKIEMNKIETPWSKNVVKLKKVKSIHSTTQKTHTEEEDKETQHTDTEQNLSKTDDTLGKKRNLAWVKKSKALKKVRVEKKEIPKEKIETIVLRSSHQNESAISKTSEDREDAFNETIQNPTLIKPWTEETIALKKTLLEVKVIPKERPEEITLKPIKKADIEEITEEDTEALQQYEQPVIKIRLLKHEDLKKKNETSKGIICEQKTVQIKQIEDKEKKRKKAATVHTVD